MKLNHRITALALTLVMSLGAAGMASAEGTDSAMSKEAATHVAGNSSNDSWTLEEQMATMLANESVTGDRIVQFIEKIQILQSIDSQTVEQCVAGLQAGTVAASVAAASDTAPSLEEQVAQLLAGSRLSEEEKSAVRSSIAQNSSGAYSISPSSIIDDDLIAARNMSVPYYKQESNDYCGPATTKQTLQYINGTSLSQDAYADLVGGWSSSKGRYCNSSDKGGSYASAMTRIVPVVNDRQNRVHYAIAGKAEFSVSQDDMKALINCGMVKNYPPIINITASGFTPNEDPDDIHANWPYTIRGGHYLNISGQYARGEAYRLTDPYYKYNDSSSDGKFQRSVSEVHDRYNNMAF